MSASVSSTLGDVAAMPTCLDEILSHAKSFDDTLNASAMLAKLLGSSSKHDEAMANCLTILSKLGEDLPQQDDISIILSKLSATQSLLRDLTPEQIKQLPPMTDKTKLNAMKFLNSKTFAIDLVFNRSFRPSRLYIYTLFQCSVHTAHFPDLC